MRALLGLLSILFLLTSCEDAYEEIVFIEIKNVKIKNATSELVQLSGDCTLFNPNPVGLDLTKAKFDVYVNGRKTAEINQDLDVKMPANQEFILPLNATMSPKDFYGEKGRGLLDATLQILVKQKVDIKYNGSIRAGKGIVTFEVPVVDSLEVPVKVF
ncbi:LEA type 2 family protein [Nonlabens mediterrranea]|uniref:LEA type 2 family protein n=1 Tax=Nonlabens mediterrranea TaxID=1419947 RepID=A0ABS0A8H4_9FLAO|nr:LEA type 2 family protein [Nonlabens mediterrranea]MBF4985820.1 LEA type 2 family protein [Nonlabens mediterrranea]